MYTERMTVAITGGARGIGLATARALHEAGAQVAIGDVDAVAVAKAGDEIGGDVVTARLDVTDRASFEAFIALAEQELGPLEVLINNAGIMPIGPFLDESDASAQRALSVNVSGVLLGCKIALPGMLERGRGHIVNVASSAGKAPTPGGVTYCATKAAIVMLTEAARVEHAGRGVEFTCVMPSFTATELIAGTKGTRFVPTVQPEDVAGAIVDVIRKPRPDVYVPRAVGIILRFQSLVGRRVRDRLARALGADRAFLDIDQSARADYTARIGGPGNPG